MIYFHTTEYCSAKKKKKRTTDKCYNMDGPQKHYAKQKERDAKD